MEAQGYKLEENFIGQDNESTIKLAKNGRKSAGPNSRHIDIRHFFVTDRIESEQLKIVHCPTDIMIGDFFTKPLQGSRFRTLRAAILGHIPMSALISTQSIQPEERVGGSTSMGQTGPTGTDDDTALPVTKKVTFASIVEKARREEKRKPKKD